MAYEWTQYDHDVLNELESGDKAQIIKAGLQLSQMQNNDEWRAIEDQYKSDQASKHLTNMNFGPDGSIEIPAMQLHLDGPLTAVSNGAKPNPYLQM